MTTIESIRKSLSNLDQDAILCDLPDSEFVTGGAITDACRAAGYDESGRVTVNNLSAWNMTVAKFAEHIAPADAITATNYHNETETFTVGQTVTHVTDEGSMHTATIKGIADGCLELAFDDGEEGSERPETCYVED